VRGRTGGRWFRFRVSGGGRALERRWRGFRRYGRASWGSVHRSAEGAAPGWGKLSTPLPTPGLAQGRTSDTKPASILRGGGRKNVSRGWCARSLAITAPCLCWVTLCALGMGFRGLAKRPAPPALISRHSGTERRVAFCVSPSGVAKGRWVVLRFEGWLDSGLRK
jgi:hypothetical protein